MHRHLLFLDLRKRILYLLPQDFLPFMRTGIYAFKFDILIACICAAMVNTALPTVGKNFLNTAWFQ